jgi:phosphoribosylaminoimidazolecarboxamide formyltransferase/IMP cyclohydrolase
MLKVKRVLISVSDKTGLIDFVKGLQAFGVEIISTGGTAKLLRGAGFSVKEVSEHTGFPEMLDGRVKTLHPAIHGGLLALRDNPKHLQEIAAQNISLIDMVVINLYPFAKVIQKKNVHLDEAIENIDIGGPSMLRSAAKNFKHVAVVCNPERYQAVLKELNNNSGILPDRLLFSLGVEAFEHTSRYDNIIYRFLNSRLQGDDPSGLPKNLLLHFQKVQDLRYGENPHQKAAFYREAADLVGLAKMKQLHGKELSYNNILDLNSGVDCLKDFENPAAVVIKHNNPTGLAEDKDLSKAYHMAYSADKLSAFGGIMAFNRKIDLKIATAIMKSGFMECLIAPGYESSALKLLKQKKNLRIIQFSFTDIKKDDFDFKKVKGGILFQQEDALKVSLSDLKVVTVKKPSSAQLESLLFAWKVVKSVKSNAIVLVKGRHVVGIGCGQTSRVGSVKIAIEKAGKQCKGSFLASDAFLPKIDNVELAAKAGIKAIIQTGGSIADHEVIKEANRRKLMMVFTGVRHFKH